MNQPQPVFGFPLKDAPEPQLRGRRSADDAPAQPLASVNDPIAAFLAPPSGFTANEFPPPFSMTSPLAPPAGVPVAVAPPAAPQSIATAPPPAPPMTPPVQLAPPVSAPAQLAPPVSPPVQMAPPASAPVQLAPPAAPPVQLAQPVSAPVQLAPPVSAPVQLAPPASAPVQLVPPVTMAPPAAPVAAVAPSIVEPVANEMDALLAEMAAAAARPAPAGRRLAKSDVDTDLLSALEQVVKLNASDLHVTVHATPMLRLHGGLQPVPGTVPWTDEKIATAIQSIMSDRQKEIFEKDLELDFAYTLTEESRFRVNVYQQRGSIGAAFRLIPTEIKQLHELGVPETINRFATLARGLVLVTGPTGSGKSTTLAALVDLVNRTRADHIVTVEDPIEFMHENKRSVVNQREVGEDTHSFAAALKHVLRQDPDVILIGELRDLETISVALTAAETGHLVFATLHTQSASQTIDRVIDVFPPHQQGQVRAQLAATLQGVVCQTLIKKATGDGRVVATEVMVATSAIANLIREGKSYQVPSAMQAGRELGMHTMDQHLADLVNSGEITMQSALEKAQDQETLKQLVHRAETNGAPTAHAVQRAAAGSKGAY